MATRTQDDADLPKIADRDEILVHLTNAVRRGNVPAMRLLLEELKADGEVARPRSTIDELARRRATS